MPERSTDHPVAVTEKKIGQTSLADTPGKQHILLRGGKSDRIFKRCEMVLDL